VVPSSISHADAGYLALVDLALREPLVLRNFRGMKEFAHVVEHSYPEFQRLEEHLAGQGQISVDDVINFATIDYVGNPIRYPCKLTGTPLSVKALKVSRLVADIMKFIGSSLDGMLIVEVGSNAGFQYKAFSDKFKVWYTAVDLRCVNLLAKKYLEQMRGCEWREFGSVKFVDYESLGMVEMYPADLFLSFYAVSECTRIVQAEYIKQFCKQCRLGFVLYNKTSGNDAMTVEEFASKIPEAVVHTRKEYEDNDGVNLITWGKPWKP
jgi:putative sugar O-methyltransferase